jgi:hypothetical protein
MPVNNTPAIDREILSKGTIYRPNIIIYKLLYFENRKYVKEAIF